MSKNVEQAQAKNLSNAWLIAHETANDLGVTAQREIKKADKLIRQAQKLSQKALGRKRKANDV